MTSAEALASGLGSASGGENGGENRVSGLAWMQAMRMFRANLEERDGTSTMALSGELDLGAVGSLSDELARAEASKPPVLVLDMAGLSFMDCAGLRIVMDAARRATDDGRRLALSNVSDQIRTLLRLTQTEQQLEFA